MALDPHETLGDAILELGANYQPLVRDMLAARKAVESEMGRMSQATADYHFAIDRLGSAMTRFIAGTAGFDQVSRRTQTALVSFKALERGVANFSTEALKAQNALALIADTAGKTAFALEESAAGFKKFADAEREATRLSRLHRDEIEAQRRAQVGLNTETGNYVRLVTEARRLEQSIPARSRADPQLRARALDPITTDPRLQVLLRQGSALGSETENPAVLFRKLLDDIKTSNAAERVAVLRAAAAPPPRQQQMAAPPESVLARDYRSAELARGRYEGRAPVPAGQSYFLAGEPARTSADVRSMLGHMQRLEAIADKIERNTGPVAPRSGFAQYERAYGTEGVKDPSEYDPFSGRVLRGFKGEVSYPVGGRPAPRELAPPRQTPEIVRQLLDDLRSGITREVVRYQGGPPIVYAGGSQPPPRYLTRDPNQPILSPGFATAGDDRMKEWTRAIEKLTRDAEKAHDIVHQSLLTPPESVTSPGMAGVRRLGAARRLLGPGEAIGRDPLESRGLPPGGIPEGTRRFKVYLDDPDERSLGRSVADAIAAAQAAMPGLPLTPGQRDLGMFPAAGRRSALAGPPPAEPIQVEVSNLDEHTLAKAIAQETMRALDAAAPPQVEVSNADDLATAIAAEEAVRQAAGGGGGLPPYLRPTTAGGDDPRDRLSASQFERFLQMAEHGGGGPGFIRPGAGERAGPSTAEIWQYIMQQRGLPSGYSPVGRPQLRPGTGYGGPQPGYHTPGRGDIVPYFPQEQLPPHMRNIFEMPPIPGAQRQPPISVQNLAQAIATREAMAAAERRMRDPLLALPPIGGTGRGAVPRRPGRAVGEYLGPAPPPPPPTDAEEQDAYNEWGRRVNRDFWDKIIGGTVLNAFVAAGGGAGGGGGPRIPVGGGGDGGDGGGGFSFGNMGGGDFARAAMFGHRGGRGLGLRIPFLGRVPIAGAGMGSVAAMAGLGAEHVVMTGLGVLGSGAAALAGAGTLAAGAAGQMAVGGGADAAVMASTIADTKTLGQALTQLTTAQDQYGKKSGQAAVAQANLNFQMKELGGGVGVKAEMQLARNAAALDTLWDKLSGPARVQAANILEQVLGLGNAYVKRVTDAAQHNLSIINEGIKPLFTWLKGPEGIKIFNDLENHFAENLPHAVHAMSQAIEVALKFIDAASFRTGGLTRTLDTLFTRLNNKPPSYWRDEVDKLVVDFQRWERFIKLLGEDLYLLFKQDAGTGNAVIETLTTMLQKLKDWETSTQGKAQLSNIFEKHKQEVVTLLNLLPALFSGLGRVYLTLAPAMTQALTGVLSVFSQMLNTMVKLGPATQWLVGLTLLSGKLFGFKNVVSAMAGSFTALGAAEKEAAAGADALATSGAITGTGRGARSAGPVRPMGGGPTGLMSNLVPLIGPEEQAAERTMKERIQSGVTQATEKGASGLASGMNRLMRGGTIALVGTGIASLIGSEVHGKVGAAISTIGSDASIGAGIGSMFGMPFAGAVGGALFGTLSKLMPDHGAKDGKAYADRFAKQLPGPIDAATRKATADAVKKAEDDAAARKPVPGSRLGAQGPGEGDRRARELYNQSFNDAYKAGTATTNQFVKGMQDVKFPSVRGLMGQMFTTLRDVPKGVRDLGPGFVKEWRDLAAKGMVEYADSLAQHGKLPRAQVDSLIASLEYKFPSLTKYLHDTGKDNEAAVASSMKLDAAKRNWGAALEDFRKQWDFSWQFGKTTNKNIYANTETAMGDLKLLMHTGSVAQREAATKEYDRLQKDMQKSFATMLQHTQDQSDSIQSAISTSTTSAYQIGSKNFQGLAQNIATYIGSGAEATGKGLDNITKQINAILKPLTGQTLGAATIKALTPAQLAATISGQVSPGAVASPHAQGGLIQVGRPGEHGPDNVLMNVGGMPIAVGAGEKVAVFNASQQTVMDRALGAQGYGGLNGMFNDVRTPHYRYAQGGFVADPGTNFSVGKEPEIAHRLDVLARALGLTIYGISGYRSPQHSVAVGGFADDPHTQGLAADIGVNGQSRPSAAKISTATLHKYGLDRPFDESNDPNNTEVNHIQLLGGGGAGAGGPGIVATYEIKAPRFAGPGVLPPALTAEFKQITAGANQYIGQQAPAGGPGFTGVLPKIAPGAAAHQIYTFFKGKGLSDVAIAGILGNWQQESSLNPGLTGSSGLGLAQWIGSRRTGAYALAAKEHVPPTSLALQLQWAWSEMTGSHGSVLPALRGARTPADAASVFETIFEGAGIPAMGNRIAYANQFFAQGLAAGGGAGAQASAARSRKPSPGKKYHAPKTIKIPKLPSFRVAGQVPARVAHYFDQINAIDSGPNSIADLQALLSYLQAEEALYPVTQIINDIDPTTGNSIASVNWGGPGPPGSAVWFPPGAVGAHVAGRIDPGTNQWAYGVDVRLGEIGPRSAGVPATRPTLNPANPFFRQAAGKPWAANIPGSGAAPATAADTTTELGLQENILALYQKELGLAQSAKHPLNEWLNPLVRKVGYWDKDGNWVPGLDQLLLQRHENRKAWMAPDKSDIEYQLTTRYDKLKKDARDLALKGHMNVALARNRLITDITNEQTQADLSVPPTVPASWVKAAGAAGAGTWANERQQEIGAITERATTRRGAVNAAGIVKNFNVSKKLSDLIFAYDEAEKADKHAVMARFAKDRIALDARIKNERDNLSNEKSALDSGNQLAAQLTGYLDPHGALQLGAIQTLKKITIPTLIQEGSSLRDMTAVNPVDIASPAADNSALLSLLLQQNALMAQQIAGESAQLAVLANLGNLLPPFGGAFAEGGIVPGAMGEPRTIIAHGGERISNGDDQAHVRVSMEDHRTRVWVNNVEHQVDQRTSAAARHARRALPGLAGGLLG